MFNIETLRQYKIFNYAIFDFAVSFIAVYLFAPLLSKLFLKLGLVITRKSWLFLTIPFSILVHILVGNFTPMTEDFLSPSGGYLVKIVIVGLFILGLKDIKKTRKK